MKKFSKFTLIHLISLALILSGCAQGGNEEKPDLYTLSDIDSDGIPDIYDYPDNETTHEIPAINPDRTISYYDCSKTPDCNRNEIPDNEEKITTAECGWGCVAGSKRGLVLISLALIGGYVTGQYLHWGFGGEKDSKGQVMEEIVLCDDPDDVPINFDESKFTFELIEGKNGLTRYNSMFVAGKCKSNLRPTCFPCTFAMRNQVDEFPEIPAEPAPLPEIEDGDLAIVSDPQDENQYMAAFDFERNAHQVLIDRIKEDMSKTSLIDDSNWGYVPTLPEVEAEVKPRAESNIVVAQPVQTEVGRRHRYIQIDNLDFSSRSCYEFKPADPDNTSVDALRTGSQEARNSYARFEPGGGSSGGGGASGCW